MKIFLTLKKASSGENTKMVLGIPILTPCVWGPKVAGMVQVIWKEAPGYLLGLFRKIYQI